MADGKLRSRCPKACNGVGLGMMYEMKKGKGEKEFKLFWISIPTTMYPPPSLLSMYIPFHF